MKIMLFISYDMSKFIEVLQATDGVVASPPQGVKVLGRWALAAPLPGYPLGTAGMLILVEAETTEALAGVQVPPCLAGGCSFPIPVVEAPVGVEAAKIAKELKR
jgi:hypothetical protein